MIGQLNRLLVLTPLLLVLSACSQQAPPAQTEVVQANDKVVESVESREAAVPENPMKEAYFGETHVHTSYSLDAYIGGNRLSPDMAYRFAKGETVTVHGEQHNIVRPLDFAAVTDHAEFIGELYSAQNKEAPGYDNELLVRLRGLDSFEEQMAWFVKYVVKPMRAGGKGHPPFYAGPETTRSAWQLMEDTARKHYEPGKFTTLLGFEWTSAPNAGNLHRNVLFRDFVAPDMPFSALDSNDEEKLWAWMEEQETHGSQLFAIPHNSNASKGQMFESTDNAGKPLAADYARQRSKREPLIEMMQIKGNSEVHRKFWPNDEFADFENGDSIQRYSDRSFQTENFVRWAVIKGLDYENKLGVNPYQMGFTGGSDTHNGTPADVVEDNYIGSHGPVDGSVQRRREAGIPDWILGKDTNPGSIAGVWAARNTRAAIWDAMQARESFVTSGTRIKPRFFCGEKLPVKPEDATALVEQGYAQGVPMGATLRGIKSAPTCSVYATKDPDAANLDRIQIIKGWAGADGSQHEKIIDVAWSGDRKPGANGKLPAVGNTVDVKTAQYTNTIGSAELLASWTDPDFDPSAPTLYYVRVLEIPTPRWTTYDAVHNNLPLLDDAPATIQERAWTSPIWVTP